MWLKYPVLPSQMMPFLSRPTVATFSPLGEKRVQVTKRECSPRLFLNLNGSTVSQIHGSLFSLPGLGNVLEGGTLKPASCEVLTASNHAIGTGGLTHNRQYRERYTAAVRDLTLKSQERIVLDLSLIHI